MADATARVAGLLAESTGSATLLLSTVAGVLVSTTTGGGTTERALGAVAGNVANLTALKRESVKDICG